MNQREKPAAGARLPPYADPALRSVAEADYPPFPAFNIPIEGRCSSYEWIAVYGDREPYASWIGYSGNPDDATKRWEMMLVFAAEAAKNLRDEIAAGTIPLVKRAYRRNRRGDTVLDDTLCVIGMEAILDFARRIGGYGNKLAELLAPRDNPKRKAMCTDKPQSSQLAYKQTKREAIKSFLAEKYSEGIPADATAKAIARSFEKERHIAASERTVRRALGRK